MSLYSFGDILHFSDIPRNLLKRWVAAGIITPIGGSPQTWRRFTLRNLIEVLVCNELRALGVNEAVLRDIVRNLNRLWDGNVEVLRADDAAATATYFLWLGHARLVVPPDNTVQHTLIMQFVDQARLIAMLDEPEAETGIVVPVSRIIRDVEEQTGDVFDFKALLKQKIAEALAKHDDEKK